MSLVGRPHARTPIILLISLVIRCRVQLCGVMGSKARAILIKLTFGCVCVVVNIIYQVGGTP